MTLFLLPILWISKIHFINDSQSVKVTINCIWVCIVLYQLTSSIYKYFVKVRNQKKKKKIIFSLHSDKIQKYWCSPHDNKPFFSNSIERKWKEENKIYVDLDDHKIFVHTFTLMIFTLSQQSTKHQPNKFEQTRKWNSNERWIDRPSGRSQSMTSFTLFSHFIVSVYFWFVEWQDAIWLGLCKSVDPQVLEILPVPGGRKYEWNMKP